MRSRRRCPPLVPPLQDESDGRMALVGAGAGIEGEVEELVLKAFLGGGGGERRAAGRSGDDREQLQLGEGDAGDVEALGVGAGVGGGEEEAGVFDQGVEQGEVCGGDAFELVAGAEGEAEPEAFGAGAGEEGAAGEALGVGGVREVEVADVADGLDVVEGQGDDAAGEVEEIERAGVDEGGVREIAGEGVSGEAAHDDLFARGGHGGRAGLGGLSHGAGGVRHEKGAGWVVKTATAC